MDVPAIKGIGNSILSFLDRHGAKGSPFDAEFAWTGEPDPESCGEGLFSRALTSPDGKIRIPINESADERSHIEEYLHQYKGEDIQHMACGFHDVYATVEALRERGRPFMPSPPDTYYERIDERVRGHGEDLDRLRRTGLLLDGEGAVALGDKEGKMTKVVLRIFSANAIGRIHPNPSRRLPRPRDLLQAPPGSRSSSTPTA